MADISMNRRHQFDLETSKQKLQKLIGKFQASRPGMIDKIEWNADQTGATASGKFFSADFAVNASSVTVELELKGFAAKMAKGMVQQQLDKTVAEEFPA